MLRTLGSASCDIADETGGTVCYGHRVLLLVISHTKQGVRFVRGIGICVLCYHTRDRGYDLLRALGSASCDLAHETGGTICYGHWVLHLVISHTRQGVRFVTGIGFFICCDITHKTGSTICWRYWDLCLVLSHTRQGYDVLQVLCSAFSDIIHETMSTICYWHWVLFLVISHTRQGGTM